MLPTGRLLCQEAFSASLGSGLNPKPETWVAVKELKLSYYLGETLLSTIYTHYGNLI